MLEIVSNLAECMRHFTQDISVSYTHLIETAHYLFKKGKQITVVEMLPEVAKDVPFAEKVVLMDEIEGKVKILTDSKVLEITDEKLIVEKNNKKKELTGFDQIVIAIGSKPDNTLYKEIKERMPELEVYILSLIHI